MNQMRRLVWPGRAVDGYANLIVSRLRKLASAKNTGMLPFSGHGEGGIFLRDGLVVYAESSRTPAWRAGGLAALGLDPGATADEQDEQAGGRGASRLATELAITEATVDAACDLIASDSRYARFKPGEAPSAGQLCEIPLEALLVEAERRHRLLRRLSTVVTADTSVVRDPRMSPASLQVSAAQWSLLLRVRGGVTPRSLAMELCGSVFGTTIEVYRLLMLGLLAVPGAQPGEPDGRGVLSFVHAVSEER